MTDSMEFGGPTLQYSPDNFSDPSIDRGPCERVDTGLVLEALKAREREQELELPSPREIFKTPRDARLVRNRLLEELRALRPEARPKTRSEMLDFIRKRLEAEARCGTR